MSDKKEEGQNKRKADPDKMLLAEVEVRQHDPNKPQRKPTAGEVAFDRIVYTGIGFGVNEASALVISDEFQHGVGRKWFESIAKWMEKAFSFKDTVKNGKLTTANANAKNMLLWGSLLISGTLLVYPMKKLEDNKGYWVKKLNHWFDRMRGNPRLDDLVRDMDGKQLSGEQLTKEDIVAARDREVEEALACEAKQTWPSLIMGRGIAVATALGLGAVIGHERSGRMMNWSEKLITGTVQPEGKKGRANRYAALAALETLSCATTSVALEIASKVFAKRGVTVRNPEVCTDLVHRNGNGSNGNGGNGDNASKNAIECAMPGEPLTAEAAARLEKFKKQPVVPSESHVDQVSKSGETSLSLSP